MDRAVYKRLREKALKAAERIGPSSFYRKHSRELEISLEVFSSNVIISGCRACLDESNMHPAHGIYHCEKVAVEAGALVYIEGARNRLRGTRTEELALCAQIAGLFHDIKRAESDHTVKGGLEAGRILEGFEMQERFKRYIVAAIRNHEAFREVLESEDEDAKMVSDCLYDADKFRWGPDNFTITLWLILESSGAPPEKLYSSFREKMEGVKRIKETFRTKTGRKFGPEFIDMGVEISDEIYRELECILGER